MNPRMIGWAGLFSAPMWLALLGAWELLLPVVR